MSRSRFLIGLGCLLWWPALLQAQMYVGQDTLYGNEWIQYDRPHYRIRLANDGVYRITYQQLAEAGALSGFSVPEGKDWLLYHQGRQVPLYVSQPGAWTAGDYLEFYGRKNRGEMDQHLFRDPNFQLNPEYSMFSDTAAYYLTWGGVDAPLRYRQPENDLSATYRPMEFCLQEQVLEYHNAFSSGKRYPGADVSTRYDIAEGYGRNVVSKDQTIAVAAPDFFSGGPDAKLTLRLHTQAGNHLLSLNWNGQTMQRDTFSDWAVRTYEGPIAAANLSNSNQLNIAGSASDDDKYRVAVIRLEYPRLLRFNNQTYAEFSLEASNEPRYLEISRFKAGTTPPILFDQTNQWRMETVVDNGLVKAVIPPSAATRKMVLVAPEALRSPSGIAPLEMVDYGKQAADYIILSHHLLFDDGAGNNYVQQYADYRASVAGGGFKTMVVDIDQVYEQFGYGIDRHEHSIKNFVQWALKNLESKYLFMIGKGVVYFTMRSNPVAWRPYDLIPSFGYPTSDNLLAADHFTEAPKLALGRLAAYTPEQVKIYLDKIKEMEHAQQHTPQTIADKAWMKKVLHVGGGDINIQDFIRDRLNQMGDTLNKSPFGADVPSLFKYSTNVVQSASATDAVNIISEGITLLTFFGHSAPNTLDFDIGSPDQYSNFGRYPVIYAMGCNTNRVFEKVNTLSEDYVFVPNRGAVAYIGSTATTSLGNLNIYGRSFYEKLGKAMYGARLGDILKSVVEDYPLGGYWGELVKANIMLHGDPAILLNPHEAPDYLVNPSRTGLTSAFVNVQQDSFQLLLSIANLGKNLGDSISVVVRHLFPDGVQKEIKKLKLPAPAFESQFILSLPLQQKNIVGNNTLLITLDADNAIAEAPAAAENNNEYQLPFVVISNNIQPIYPLEYGLVHDEKIVLKASTQNAFAPALRYFFELDTTPDFDSPFKKAVSLESSGGVLSWQPDVNWKDSQVYFWRASLDSTATGGLGFDWREHSFTYSIDTGTGWGQNEISQILRGKTEVSILLEDQNIIFNRKKSNIKVSNGAFPILFWEEAAVFISEFRYVNYWPCPTGEYNNHTTFWMLAFHPDRHEYRNIDNSGGTYNCWNNPNAVFIKGMKDVEERRAAVEFINSYVPSGDYVIVFTTQTLNSTLHADQWAIDSLEIGTNIFQALEYQGATQIRDLAEQTKPYIFIFQKDNPNWTGKREILAESVDDIIQTTSELVGRYPSGSITSTAIGPSLSWDRLSWKITEKESHDFAGVDIIGINTSGEEKLLHQNIQAGDTTLRHISAEEYPFLKLRLNLVDSVNYTAPQLDYWRVYYEPATELALNPSAHFVFRSDTLQQGQPLEMQLAVENVSTTAADSVLVKYQVTDAQNRATAQLHRLAPLEAMDSLVLRYQYDTKSAAGPQRLSIEVNPDKDQPEQFHFNNLGVKEFFVQSDDTNPLLDVTFDGVHIFNGDLVSARPLVRMELRDDSPYLVLSDTNTFTVSVIYPSGTSRRLPWNDPELLFTPAQSGSTNKARLEWSPQFVEDGTYRLKVEGRDASGNASGPAYEVDFQVINEARISNVLNYPNPFSTATQFVFTLTGAQLPSDLAIQIMTVTGQVVRTIDLAELGPLRVGVNRTDYRWDGTDQFGDKLANGVYLYRVTAKDQDQQDYKHYDTGTDGFFKNGIGKLVILR